MYNSGYTVYQGYVSSIQKHHFNKQPASLKMFTLLLLFKMTKMDWKMK